MAERQNWTWKALPLQYMAVQKRAVDVHMYYVLATFRASPRVICPTQSRPHVSLNPNLPRPFFSFHEIFAARRESYVRDRARPVRSIVQLRLSARTAPSTNPAHSSTLSSPGSRPVLATAGGVQRAETKQVAAMGAGALCERLPVRLLLQPQS
jgi:hypothetical protein